MAINKERNYYKILHVQPDAPDQVIKASYRTMMQRLRMHPDLGGDHLTAALINEAFRTIGDPARRALYDRFVFSQQFAQNDPWAERAQGKDAHEFRPVADLTLHEAAE